MKRIFAGLTANSFADDIRDSMSAGMDAHVSKPVDMNRLARILAEFWKRWPIACRRKAPGEAAMAIYCAGLFSLIFAIFSSSASAAITLHYGELAGLTNKLHERRIGLGGWETGYRVMLFMSLRG